jgi:hypothetical protein
LNGGGIEGSYFLSVENTHFICMEFEHFPGANKKGEIAGTSSKYSKDLEPEIPASRMPGTQKERKCVPEVQISRIL